jgi:tartrate-resistant acid phosphatase type 5
LIAWWAGCSEGVVPAAAALAPELADPDRARFVAVGDTGKGTADQAAVAEALATVCGELGCDFVLLLGDNLYPAGLETPDDPRAAAVIAEPYADVAPVYAILGNHDWAGWRREVADREVAWAEGDGRVRLPANAWWFDAGPARVVGVDTTAAMVDGAAFQAAWARERLDSAPGPWAVLAGHHPLRSDGPHGNAGAYEGWRWVPYLSGAGVAELYADTCGAADLLLAGHDHTRQVLPACGATQVVAGTGAAATRVVDRGNSPSFADAELGFAWLELGPDTGEVRFYGVSGVVDARIELAPRADHP